MSRGAAATWTSQEGRKEDLEEEHSTPEICA